MIPKDFLEGQSLYVPYKITLENDVESLEFPNVNLFCPKCISEQTFKYYTSYLGPIPSHQRTRSDDIFPHTPIAGEVYLSEYHCAGCDDFKRFFLIKISENLDNIKKFGQYPEFDISTDKNIKKMLGKHGKIFINGRINEVHGYGIGAFAYYRRIVEVIIDDLLEKIWTLHSERDREKHQGKIKEIKESKDTGEKINIAKDILPDSLHQEGVNPLKTLYDVLSEGIHSNSDEECIKLAEIIRGIIVPLVNQVTTTIESQKEIKDRTKQLLNKRKL